VDGLAFERHCLAERRTGLRRQLLLETRLECEVSGMDNQLAHLSIKSRGGGERRPNSTRARNKKQRTFQFAAESGGRDPGAPRLNCRRSWGSRAIGPASFYQMTYRKSRCVALPPPELARLPPAEVARLPPAEVTRLPPAAATPANYRTSSNKPACHPRFGQWAHTGRPVRSGSSVATWFAPMPVTRSGELQI
jgi:hypothetical protein